MRAGFVRQLSGALADRWRDARGGWSAGRGRAKSARSVARPPACRPAKPVVFFGITQVWLVEHEGMHSL